MKDIKIVSFTKDGSRLNRRLGKKLFLLGYHRECFTTDQTAEDTGLERLPANFVPWIGENWGSSVFVFIGAMGIVIRSIAPFVRDEFTDSAVFCVDEAGRYVIPMITCYQDETRELAGQIASGTGGEVISMSGIPEEKRFDLREFTGNNQLIISDPAAAEKVQAAILAGEKVGFYSRYPVEGSCPKDLCICGKEEDLKNYAYGILVAEEGEAQATGKVLEKESEKASDRAAEMSLEAISEEEGILRMIPKNIVVGISCRRGIGTELLEQKLQEVFKEKGILPEQVCMLASIDSKKDEIGILELARKYQVPFETYPAERLKQVESISSGSAFIQQVMGVDNICERAAILAGNNGKVLQPKTGRGETTFALVQKKEKVWWKIN